jgi:hypothetical protein
MNKKNTVISDMQEAQTRDDIERHERMIKKVDNNVDDIIGSIEIEVIKVHKHDIHLGRGTPGEQLDHFLDDEEYNNDEKVRKITIHIDECD